MNSIVVPSLPNLSVFSREIAMVRAKDYDGVVPKTLIFQGLDNFPNLLIDQTD